MNELEFAGVDVPKLNLVVRYDLPKLYGSYIQSRGRARAPKSHYVMLMDCEQDANFRVDLQNFRDIEKVSVCTMCVCGDVCTVCT